jgi:hypothetical protein
LCRGISRFGNQGSSSNVVSTFQGMQRATIAICVRVLVALLTCTFFQPDEYFQSLEPAHATVFGYGHLTWEWLASRPIRSAAYPALNIPVYWMLKVTGLDSQYPSLLVRIISSIPHDMSYRPSFVRLQVQKYCTAQLPPRQMCGFVNLRQD